MKIAILGGGFDPPHLGHLLIAHQVKDICKMDQIWLMPCYKHPLSKNVSDPFHRLKMTRFLESDGLITSNYEINKNHSSYTVDTLFKLNKLYPKNTYYFIIGSDNLQVFNQWKDWQILIKEYNLIIFPREIALSNLLPLVKKTFKLNTLPTNITVIQSKNLVMTNISSTLIRSRIKKKQSIRYLVPEKVEKYILENKLYK